MSSPPPGAAAAEALIYGNFADAATKARAATYRSKREAANARVEQSKRDAEHEAMLRGMHRRQQQVWTKPHVRGLQPSPLDSYRGPRHLVYKDAEAESRAAEAQSRTAIRAAAAEAIKKVKLQPRRKFGGTLKHRKRNRSRHLRSS